MKKLFTFIPSNEPQLEDDIYELKSDNNIYIQINDGIYLVHKYYLGINGNEDEGCCETLGEFKSLKNAMKKALEIRYNDFDKIRGGVSTSIFRERNELATILNKMYHISK